MFRDVRVDLVGQAFEVGGLERSVGLENEYSFWQKQLVVEHVSSSPVKCSMSNPHFRVDWQP
jgi:hypothetical protein